MSISFSIVDPKQRGVFNFSVPDKIVEFAIAHHAKVKGHALVSGSSLPEWLTKGNFSPDELKEILKNHVQTIVKHYKDKYPGTVIVWHVVNEAVCNGGKITDDKICISDAGIEKNIWTSIHKPGSTDPTDYIQLAFQWAREADPQVKLYLNENRLEANNHPKTDRAFDLVKHLKDKGTPIDGIGFQCHLRLYEKDKYSAQGFTAIMDRFASLGLESQVTEFDVMLASGNANTGKLTSSSPSVPVPIAKPTTDDLKEQAELYRMFLHACLNAKNCTGFSTWGPWDAGSWTALHWKGSYQPHLLNDKLQPKLTYKYLQDEANSIRN